MLMMNESSVEDSSLITSTSLIRFEKSLIMDVAFKGCRTKASFGNILVLGLLWLQPSMAIKRYMDIRLRYFIGRKLNKA